MGGGNIGSSAKDAAGGVRDKAVDKAKEVGKDAADKMQDTKK